MQIQFLGAAGTVTGSKTLLTAGDTRLLVDCGMFQGFKHLRRRNWEALELPPADLDAVVLTHAHLDHSGLLPVLAREGFKGRIFCTEATRDLARLILTDSGHIQEEDARHANKKGYSRHSPAQPLYTEDAAERCLTRFSTVAWGQPFEVGPLRVTLQPAGHILGASMVRVDDGTTSVLFSGDLGRPEDRVMNPPWGPEPVDYLVLESTYGGRAHATEDPIQALAAIVRRTVARKGVLLVPSFAVGRAQAILWALYLLMERGEVPEVDVVLDSPMAAGTTELYRHFHEQIRLTEEDMRALRREVRFTRTPMESKQLNGQDGPFILVSASGMLTGGRILHHIANRAGNPRNTLLFVGYQAPGTRGGDIVRGERKVKIHGSEVTIDCEVATIDGFSAHTDQDETLSWLAHFEQPPVRTWLNHGEPDSGETLRAAITRQLGWEVELAREGVVFPLEPRAEAHPPAPPPPVPATPRTLPATPSAPGLAMAAGLDPAFLALDELRPARLMLAAQRVDSALRARGVQGLVVTLGRPLPEGDPLLAEAHAFGRAVATAPAFRGLLLATTARPGIAAAVAQGARDAGGGVAGVHAARPGEPLPGAWVQPSLCFRLEHTALRDLLLLERARAVVAFPADSDTLATVLRALDLAQGAQLPVVLVGASFWRDLLAILGRPLDGVLLVDTAEEAVAALSARLSG
ncbi:MAG: MBL fold metallo-hydrolase [Pseudomonadota bacterium]